MSAAGERREASVSLVRGVVAGDWSKECGWAIERRRREKEGQNCLEILTARDSGRIFHEGSSGQLTMCPAMTSISFLELKHIGHLLGTKSATRSFRKIAWISVENE